jgi:hypothetical protein
LTTKLKASEKKKETQKGPGRREYDGDMREHQPSPSRYEKGLGKDKEKKMKSRKTVNAEW